MRRITPNPRGMALIMAMIVVVLITMLVAGAISFTGTELAAAEVQTQESSMSACVQAARNLFLSKLRRVMTDETVSQGGGTVRYLPIQFDENFRTTEGNPQGVGTPPPGVVLKTGHLGSPVGVMELSARRADALIDKLKNQGDDTDRGKRNSAPAFYTVTAVCKDTTTPNGPEREIEFMVRVGI